MNEGYAIPPLVSSLALKCVVRVVYQSYSTQFVTCLLGPCPPPRVVDDRIVRLLSIGHEIVQRRSKTFKSFAMVAVRSWLL